MPHCDSIFPDIGLVKIHIHNSHKEVRHKYAEVNKTDAANNFKLLSGMSADIAQNWQGFNGQNRTSVCSSSWHNPSEQSDDQVGERDRSLLRSNCGDRHGDQNHGHGGIDKLKVINIWIYNNYCLKIIN